MKKCILLLIFTLYTFLAQAQAEGPLTGQQDHNIFSYAYAPNAGFGIKAGVNFSDVRGSDSDRRGKTSGHTNFHAGVFAQIPIGDRFSIQPEALYSRKGFERADSVFRFDYLELPVLAGFSITDHFSVYLGPQVSIMMSAKQEGKEVELEPYNTFDYGFAAGAEARISRFRVGSRYNMYFADLRNKNNAGQRINEAIRQQVVHVYLGIGF